IQIKSDRSIHFSFYQEIRPHGSLGYKTPNEYDEYSRGKGCEKVVINRFVIVKKWNSLNYTLANVKIK
ncbi:MAG TPA: hypothetical protein PLL03_08760, partial [Fervidobacterium sp.]|nr:hypothetical protein [Fervidobacterium sp.]